MKYSIKRIRKPVCQRFADLEETSKSILPILASDVLVFCARIDKDQYDSTSARAAVRCYFSEVDSRSVRGCIFRFRIPDVPFLHDRRPERRAVPIRRAAVLFYKLIKLSIFFLEERLVSFSKYSLDLKVERLHFLFFCGGRTAWLRRRRRHRSRQTGGSVGRRRRCRGGYRRAYEGRDRGAVWENRGEQRRARLG